MLNLSLLVLTRLVGYKSQSESLVQVSYHFETKPNDFCPEVLGDTFEDIIIDSIEIEGIAKLSNEFDAEYTGEVTDGARDHIIGLVKSYIRFGDQRPLTGQIVYKFDVTNEAYNAMRNFYKTRNKAV